MISIVTLLIIAFVAWLWADSLHAKKIAVDVSKRACEIRKLQLLDDTAALASVSIRKQNSRFCIWRTYKFEYYQADNQRLSSTITLCGKIVVRLGLTNRNNIVQFPNNSDQQTSSH